MKTQTLTNIVQQDIQQLEERIDAFNGGTLNEERFKLFRLTRGVYGQRQLGVQMIRTKVPIGRMNTNQLRTIAALSNQYASGNLHITTRQNIQLHYVKLDDAPKVWRSLEEVGITLREACGNTVRNITGSSFAGIDPDEPFDITPYALALYEHFLRNPLGGEMGRKIKIAFSSSEKDSAFTYFHDIGFIPVWNDGPGFRVLVGGGLGAQPFAAQLFTAFLPVEDLLSFSTALIRVFDRLGEREKRLKARLKFLIKDIGIDAFRELVTDEWKNISVPLELGAELHKVAAHDIQKVELPDHLELAYKRFVHTNVHKQKNSNLKAVGVRIPRGDLDWRTATVLAEVIESLANNHFRLTVKQGIVLTDVHPDNLPALFLALEELKLAGPGAGTILDVTSCPGSDTCNLAVTNSTGLASELEAVLQDEYYDLVASEIRVNISGCMNSCGQHMAADIGFHGSSIKVDGQVAPAMQVVLAGGLDHLNQGRIADKVIKLPTKRVPDALRTLLNDYEQGAGEGEYFKQYFDRRGKIYFYDLLKELADTSTLGEKDFVDWGSEQQFQRSIGVGECAGVLLDVVDSIFADAKDKLDLSKYAIQDGAYADAAYHAYASAIHSAKGILLSLDIKCNSHQQIIQAFEDHVVQADLIELDTPFASRILEIKERSAGREFSEGYLHFAREFYLKTKGLRASLKNEKELVAVSHYNA